MQAKLSPVGYWLKHYREKRGLSQGGLGRLTSMGKSWPWLVETGVIANPGLNSLREVARALGVEVGDLVQPMPTKKRKAAA